jgi:hypothetical protein
MIWELQMIYEDVSMDAQYMDAVKRRDTETAQKMVDEAARKNGYNNVLWRGGEEFVVADMRKPYIWLAVDRNYAKYYGVPKKYFTNVDNPLDLTFLGENSIYRMSREEVVNIFQTKNINLQKDDIDINKLGGGEPLFRVFTMDHNKIIKNKIIQAGYDSIIFYESRGIEQPPAYQVIALFQPNQLKIADVVVKDDKKQIIPLSQRFNTSINNIKY